MHTQNSRRIPVALILIFLLGASSAPALAEEPGLAAGFSRYIQAWSSLLREQSGSGKTADASGDEAPDMGSTINPNGLANSEIGATINPNGLTDPEIGATISPNG